ncbi:MAG: metallophosphoesterase [Eubacteriales bacterium]|nr:metallophosphoesterase [Eubacteriales bacterium]
MPDFVHTGDIHLESAFSAHLNAVDAMQRRNDVMHNFSEIIRLASKTELLFISGDLFDSPNVSADTISFVKRKFAEIPDTHIFIAAGNHDPYTSDSVYAKIDFGKNVHVFDIEPECVELSDTKTRVYGVSFPNSAPGRLKFPVIDKDGDFNNFVVLHADLTSDLSGIYNPISLTDIQNSGADYVALGHIHKRCEPQKIGDTIFAYCGIPEGRGFDECGNLGCYIGHTEDSITTVHFHRTCVKRLFDIKLDISSAEDTFHIYETAIQEMQNIGSANDLYRITLCGRTNIDDINCSVIKTRLCDYGILTDVIDETKPKYEPDDFSDDAGICGEVVGMTDNMMSLSESGDSSAKESLNSFLCRYTQGRVGLSDLDAELLKNAELIGLAALLGGD